MLAAGGDPTRWLAQTKLQPPPPRSNLLARPRLLDLLREGLLSSRLTLVSAPAGYGKTTLLASLPALAPDLPLAWLSLEEEDGDPARFLTAVVLALRRLLPDCGRSVLSLLHPSPSPTPDPLRMVGALVNDLVEGVVVPTVMVLDDLHTITEPSAYGSLEHLLERMPSHLHVAVATRQDPPLCLSRLRGRGELAELRMRELQFTGDEVAGLLNDHLHLDLDAEDLARLHARIEGWPVGLGLLARSLLRMRAREERASFIALLARVDRYLFDYLAEEVLDRQSPSLRWFLVETSILPELTADLCRAVTGREDAATLLEELDRRSLFLVALNEARTGFRYHSLFAEFLQGRLRRELPDLAAELHRRAARAAASPVQAVAHRLAAGEWAEAATTVERAGASLLGQGMAGTVAGWIQALPTSVSCERPRLMLLRGLCSFARGDLPAARSDLEEAVRLFESASDEAGLAEGLGHLATCAAIQADFVAAEVSVQRALANPMPARPRVRLRMIGCWLALLRHAWAEALADLDAALEELEAGGDRNSLVDVALLLRLDMAAAPGVLERIERFTAQAMPLLGEGPSLAGIAVQELLVFAHLWRGRLSQAVQVAEQAVAEVERLGGHPCLGASAAGFGSMAYLALGDWAGAERLVEIAFQQMKAIPMGQVYMATPLYFRAKLRLLQGDLEGARQACQRLMETARERESTESGTLRWKLRGHLAMAERRYAAAELAMREAVALEEGASAGRLFGSVRVLLARLAFERNRAEAALAELEPVLAECEREDTPGRILVDGQEAKPVLRLALRRGVHPAFARRLLSLLGASAEPAPLRVPATGETLTAREAEILALLAAGAGNREIAAHLVIEVTTIKRHITHLLRKLNVSSRGQAAARARELGLPGSAPAVS